MLYNHSNDISGKHLTTLCVVRLIIEKRKLCSRLMRVSMKQKSNIIQKCTWKSI